LTFIADLDNASFPDSTREAFTIFKLPISWISYCHAYGCVSLDSFNIVSLPLDKALVHCRRDATISMDLVSTKEYTVCPFAMDDKENSRQGFTPNHQFDVNYPRVLDALPPKSFNIMLVSSKSSGPFPSFWSMV
jgi:hypothetical protein